MTREEFIKTACSLGYCNPAQAMEYCKDKTTLTDDDFIEVYRMVEAQRHRYHGRPLGEGSYTSKRYLRNGEDNQ